MDTSQSMSVSFMAHRAEPIERQDYRDNSFPKVRLQARRILKRRVWRRARHAGYLAKRP